jgi:hypothetical protein
MNSGLSVAEKESCRGGTRRGQTGGSHYQLPIQPVDYIYENGLGYLEGNVVKYVTRHKTKNGAEDIRKAIDYLNMILEKVYDE